MREVPGGARATLRVSSRRDPRPAGKALEQPLSAVELSIALAFLLSDLYDPPPVIRLRRMLERGRAHPVLGPILLIALAVLLSLVLLHVVLDGSAAAEIGAMCLALASFLGVPLLERLRGRLSEPLGSVRGDRGPPSLCTRHVLRPAVVAVQSRSLLLRR